MAIMADVDELVCYPIVIDVKVTRDVHVDEVIVYRLPSSGIGTIWHISVVPVVDIIHCLALIWGMIMGPGTVKVDLINLGARNSVQFTVRVDLHDGE